MNQQDRRMIADMYSDAKRLQQDVHQFAQWLIENYPTLVVEIIRQYLKDTEQEPRP